ncbi:hypothetical protein NQ315_016206 [Exocentrus adspersus]|uniref:DUF5641 domain-containing protein n=1 Tax=Exocentrus adspersus TaxID=1586481 RepID=A0AAV8VIX6_9CUCU|nr:hypothetical protein NQ315_016206 [Exocentrus adspersus]
MPDNRLKLFEQLQKLVQHFWRRWAAEYLTSLQPRGKWKKSNPGLRVGDLVLIQEDNLPVLQWKTGRVTTLHPGKDGITRVVSVLVRGGEIKRSVANIKILW